LAQAAAHWDGWVLVQMSDYITDQFNDSVPAG